MLFRSENDNAGLLYFDHRQIKTDTRCAVMIVFYFGVHKKFKYLC